MLYVYKQSESPICAWTLSRVGGKNNIAPQVPARYLVLHTAECVKRDGMWHYVFEFDTRNSLEMSPLAMLVYGNYTHTRYPDGADWRRWLGDDWRIIDEHARWSILNGVEQPEAAICDVRDLPAWDPLVRHLNPPLPAPPAPQRSVPRQSDSIEYLGLQNGIVPA